MKLNTDKCHILIAENRGDPISAKIGSSKIIESDSVKLLGVNTDNELKFTKHVTNLCVQTNRKLTAISSYANYLPHD